MCRVVVWTPAVLFPYSVAHVLPLLTCIAYIIYIYILFVLLFSFTFFYSVNFQNQSPASTGLFYWIEGFLTGWLTACWHQGPSKKTSWPAEQVTMWSGDHVIRWLADQVTSWPADQVKDQQLLVPLGPPTLLAVLRYSTTWKRLKAQILMKHAVFVSELMIIINGCG